MVEALCRHCGLEIIQYSHANGKPYWVHTPKSWTIILNAGPTEEHECRPDEDFAVCGDCGQPIPSKCDGQCKPPTSGCQHDEDDDRLSLHWREDEFGQEYRIVCGCPCDKCTEY